MARVTIEDSMIHCPNIFFLIQLAAKRAHQLQHGAEPLIPVYKNREGRVDAPTVFALREIAAGFVDFDNVEIPEKDAFGKLVYTRKRDYQKTEREQLTDENNIYYVRNKNTGEIVASDLTLAEAEACKARIGELIVELRKKKQEDKDNGTNIL